jgi:glutathionyl-hydroquinone reductase
MGQLIDGIWRDEWYDTKKTGGRFVRKDASFRDWVAAEDASALGRYHLYVSLACPWAHRTLIFRVLKKLEDTVSVSVVEPLMLEQGWTFPEDDPLTGCRHLHQIYTRARADYTGRVTVPVLWDKQKGTIVNNESAEIIRMFNSAFGGSGDDFYPQALRAGIDDINAFVYERINNGVYRAGFATTQAAYEEAFDSLFNALDILEDRLASNRYLLGDAITEADWRLFTTLVRFDPVYHGHFKCNGRRLMDYPNLWGYTRDLFQVPGVAGTVNMDHIKRHYYGSHATLNPSGVVPKGPDIDFMSPHGR